MPTTMEKLVEHTNEDNVFMRMNLNGRTEEITVSVRHDLDRESDITYRTSADNNPERRTKIIRLFYAICTVFHELY